jgi:hypothetical protein
MSEHCTVQFVGPAERELQKLARRDPRRLLSIQALVRQVEEQGWKLSTNSEAIKVLRRPTCIAEMRSMGRGGYRLFLFWHDEGELRTLWVCRVLPKSDVVGKRRLSDVCDSVEAIRRRFLQEGG